MKIAMAISLSILLGPIILLCAMTLVGMVIDTLRGREYDDGMATLAAIAGLVFGCILVAAWMEAL